ncbi:MULTISPECIES: hypothetical protein [Salinibaculum]|uniref:hypothetical protein n=1 Tax=Salinibaculum TaxID=2732368 RepID=UPI0030CF1293
MTSDYPPTLSARRSNRTDVHPTVGTAIGAALVSLALLLALSYPVLTLALVTGALSPRLLRRARTIVTDLRAPTSPPVRRTEHRARP